MAIATQLLETSNSGTNLTVYTTSSVTADPDTLLVVFVCGVAGTREATLTASGLTFVPQQRTAWNTANTIECHTALVGGAGFTGAITITFSGGVNQCHWSVIEVTGHDPAAPIVQCPEATQGTGTTGSATLAAAGHADNRSFGCAAHAAFEASVHPTGFAELGDSPGNSPANGWHSWWHATAFQTACAPSWVTSAAFAILACEVKCAPAFATIEGAAVFEVAAPTFTAEGLLEALGVAAFEVAAVAFTAAGEQAGPLVITTGARVYAPGWAGLAAAAREAAEIKRDADAADLVDCPYCGTPLERARGIVHCPFGDYTRRG